MQGVACCAPSWLGRGGFDSGLAAAARSKLPAYKEHGMADGTMTAFRFCRCAAYGLGRELRTVVDRADEWVGHLQLNRKAAQREVRDVAWKEEPYARP